MKEKTRALLKKIRGVWFILVVMIMVYQLVSFLISGSFGELSMARGHGFALLFVILVFIGVFAVLQLPAIIIHLILFFSKK